MPPLKSVCRRLGLALVTLFLAQRAPAEIPQPAPRPDLNPAIWVAKDKDTTVYLFGSVHALDGKAEWFNDEVRRSFDKSQELVLEVIVPDDPAKVAPLAQKYGIDTQRTLSSKLSPEGRKLLAERFKAEGLPPQMYERLKPFYAAIVLAGFDMKRLGLDASTGVEHVLTEEAKREGKSIGSVETLDFQMSLFDALPEAEQVRLLESALKDDKDSKAELAQLVKDWGAGRADKVAKEESETERESAALYKMLLVDRNRRWADWIADRMKQPGTVFMAVGAGHLAGPDSVQHFLAAKGIVARRMPHVPDRVTRH
ncbi:TraB/GumN family protein [Sphingomonas sp. ASV193]|uniref:TraB/GumN family protein n=1 Tax=Sphingomonas sp. ASV193 TaxID=3144405 RepID=UPI0032E89152